jgi:hypothetical protein
MIVNYELGIILKDTVVVSLKAISQHLFGGTEENNENFSKNNGS